MKWRGQLCWTVSLRCGCRWCWCERSLSNSIGSLEGKKPPLEVLLTRQPLPWRMVKHIYERHWDIGTTAWNSSREALSFTSFVGFSSNFIQT